MSDDKLIQAAKHLAEMMHVNSVDRDIRSRIAAAVTGGYDFGDTMHNIFLDFGYPAQLDFHKYYNMYRRFGIAQNVCELPVDITWMTTPTITGSGQFEREFATLIKLSKFWQRMKALDQRQRVGRYAGLFMRVRDGKHPKEPLTGKLPGVNALIEMIPLYEGQLQVSSTESNVMADDFGKPSMYLYQSTGVGNQNSQLATSIQVHPSRIVIAAEGADDGGIYGKSVMESIYNSLMDLRKIIGAGGEGFYKNAAQNIVFDLKDGASANQNKAILEKFTDNVDDFMQNRFRRSLWTPGMEAKTLESMLSNPKEFFMNALNDVAAGSKIPATVIIGMQTGRLASTEDSRSLLSTVNSRRENQANDQLNSVIEWAIKYGILPSSEYEIEWDDLLALGDSEKLDNAVKMAQINQNQFNSGGTSPFTGDEVRVAAGYEAENDDE